MSERRIPQSYKELLQVLFELFEEVEPGTPDEVASYLADRGYNREDLVLVMRTEVEKAIGESPLNWRNTVDYGHTRKFDLSQAKKKQLPSRQDILAAIRGIYTRRNVPLVAHFRNLEEATDEDLLSLLEDLQELDDEQEE